MEIAAFNVAVAQAVRDRLVSLLRAHPEWNLLLIMAHIDRGGALCDELGSLSIAELLDAEVELFRGDTTGEIDLDRLLCAERLEGQEYAAIVLEILVEAGRPVRAGYVRRRAGGPRWKLSKALKGLQDRGMVARRGTTSDTTWTYLGVPCG